MHLGEALGRELGEGKDRPWSPVGYRERKAAAPGHSMHWAVGYPKDLRNDCQVGRWE